MSDIEEMVKRLRAGTNGWNSNPAMKAAADVLEAQAKRIAELEASLADSNEALQVMGLLLSDADAVNSQLVTEAAHNTKMIEAGSRRDECKINLIKKQNEQIAALKKKLRDEYDDYPADELQDQSHSANTVATPVMDAAPACEPARIASETIAAGHPCFDPDGPPDHDWEYVDESFSHEFGTEICGHYECARCNASKPE